LFKRILNHIRQGTFFSVLLQNKAAKQRERRVQKTLDRKLDLPDQDVLAGVEKTLKKYFNNPLSTYEGLPNDYIRNIARFIISRRSRKLLPDEEYYALLQQTEELDHTGISCANWKRLCYLAFCNGLFQVSARLRDKAIKNAYQNLDSKDPNPGGLIEAFKAAVDQADYQAAEAVLGRISGKFYDQAYLNNLSLYYYLMKRDKEKAWSLVQPLLTANDLAYADYLKGKSVAVVGPAPSGEDLGSEIDSYDIVVRPHYKGKEYVPNSKEFGTRVNVSYYGGIIKTINEFDNLHFFNALDYAVFKAIKYPFQEKMYKKQHSRVCFSTKVLLFNGVANMIPLIIFDLLHFKTSKLKVFKVNFHLAEQLYYDGYAFKGEEASFISRWPLFAGHNQITQLNFTRNLWYSGQIEVDESCEAVLRLTNEEYMSKMEDIYVKEPIKKS